MRIPIYQVDAFADKVFTGNPAAVCPLDMWLPDNVMQNIALENNLAETVFYVKEKEGLRIRWFTPAIEVDLCGHATLAAAFVLFNHEGYRGDSIGFNSRSGILTVTRKGDSLTLNFPTDILSEVTLSPTLTDGLNETPIRALKGKDDYLLVFENESQKRHLQPDLRQLARIKSRGIIVTAPGEKVDFVSRFFGPQSGVDEDPVTGSAHTTLTAYWSGVLGKTELVAQQLSKRGGKLSCKLIGDRVEITGSARLYMQGTISLDL